MTHKSLKNKAQLNKILYLVLLVKLPLKALEALRSSVSESLILQGEGIETQSTQWRCLSSGL